jgi:hypothetical protein
VDSQSSGEESGLTDQDFVGARCNVFARKGKNYLLEINILSNSQHKAHTINGKETVKRQASDLHKIDC